MSNPNPSPKTRFGKGNNANPAGKTSKQKRTEMANAERAVAIREKILVQLEAQIDSIIEEGESLDSILGHLNPHTLKMLKDAEDRGLGAPVQPITSPDGSMKPTIIELVGVPVPNDKSKD